MLMQYVRSRWPMVMCGPNGQLSQYDEDRPSPSCHLRSHTSVHPTMNLSLNPMPHIISSSKCLQCNTLFCTAMRPPPVIQLVVVSSCMRRDLLCGLSRLTIWQSGNLLPGRNFRQSHSFFRSLYGVPLSTWLQLLMQSKFIRFWYDPESRRLEREEVIIERSPSAIIE